MLNSRMSMPAALALAALIAAGSASAAVRTWTGLGTDNNWSTTNNWSGGVKPGPTDDAYFDGTSVKDAVVDAAFGGTVSNLTLAIGYTGTNTLNRSLTVNKAYAQSDGTFNASATTNMTVGLGSAVNLGNFSLAGGTFTCPTNTLTIIGYDNTFAQSGGTFNHNNGTVVFKNYRTTFNAPNMTFFGLTVDMATSTDGNNAVIMAAGTTNVVLGTLVHNCGFIRQSAGATATLEARSNVVVGAAAKGGNANIALLVAGDQTIVCSNGITCGLYINKPSGLVSAIGGDLGVGSGGNGYSGNFTLVGGTFNSTSNTFYFRGYNHAWTVGTGATFNHNNGRVAFSSWVAGVVATNVTFYNLNAGVGDNGYLVFSVNATNVVLGNLTQTTGGFRNGTLELHGDMIISNTAITGGDAVIAFLTADDQTITCISTNATTCSLLIDKPSGSVTVVGDALKLKAIGGGASGGHFTLARGTFNGPTNLFLVNSYSSVWTHRGGTITPGFWTLQFLGWSPSLSATNQSFYKLILDTPIVAGMPGNGLTLTAGTTNTILSTFIHTTGQLKTGTLIAQGDVSIDSAGGGTAAFIFGGTNTQVYTNTKGTNVAGVVTVNKTGGSLILASPMAYTNANQDMTVTAGTLDLAGQPLTVSRTLTLGALGRLKFNGTEQATAKNVTVLPGATLELRSP